MRSLFFLLITALITITHCAFLRAAEGTVLLTPEHAVKFRRISDLHFSPDGSSAVCVVSEVNGPTIETHIWLADLNTRQLGQFTFSQKNERLPQWAPRGDSLAFLSNRAGPTQVYVVPRSGGEARSLTASGSDVTDFRWSPDGKQIAYLAREPDSKRDGNAPHIADHEQDVERLWVLDLASGSTRTLTNGSIRIEAFDWVSSERIVAMAAEQPRLETWHSALYEIPVADQVPRLIGEPNQPWRGLWLSPSRKQLSLVSTRSAGPIPHDLFLQSVAGGTARDVTSSVDRAVLDARWESDTAIVILIADGFTNRLIRVSDRGTPTNIELPYSVRAFDVARSGKIVFAGVGFNRLPELFVRLANGSVSQIGELQRGWEGLRLTDAEVFHFKSFDGRAIEAALMKPQAVHGGKSALVVLVHGGPASNFSADYFWFNAWPQLLAARGYQVLMVNPRGSIGYGEEFVAANRGDLGGGDFKDILAALDAVLARGEVDANRVGIGGWSYGGQMTQWAIAHTNRFRAAVSGGGVFDEAAEFGTEDSPAGDEWYFGAPWEHPEVYARNSPSTYIASARTPTLILHGEDDPTNPVTQSRALYRALKRLGVETELVTYPGEGHLPRQELHQVDILTRMLDWFDRHL
jgi:dipeptidyl aminopeptidase/acylaminoacyl peptidase